MKAAYLRRMFPADHVYTEIRRQLLDGGAIVCDRHYIEGKKCLGYKLGAELAAMRQQRVAITDTTLLRKIRKCREMHSDSDAAIHAPEPVHQYLLNWFRSIEIDLPAALDWLLNESEDFEPPHETAIWMLHDREIRFRVCGYGRVHTNLTNLKSELREFLSYRESPLVNLDIRNSQPLIFAILLREHYGAASEFPADVEHYIELVQTGRFYDHLMAEWGIPPERRDNFKKKFFGHVFFCRNWPETDVARRFGERFPSVYTAVRSMKERDYRNLAHRLQRAESDLMIGGVAHRCMTDLPDTFIATIHDSIVTTPDRADAVRSIMLREFLRLGLRPTIRIESLHRPGRSDNCLRVAS